MGGDWVTAEAAPEAVAEAEAAPEVAPEAVAEEDAEAYAKVVAEAAAEEFWGLGSGSVKRQRCTEVAALQALQVQWHASCRPHLHGTHC